MIKDLAIIKKYYPGIIDNDVVGGWESAKRGAKRDPPRHLTASRYLKWMDGYKAFRKRKKDKETWFFAHLPNGEQYKIIRKGYIPRRILVTQAERVGCAGDVMVYHVDFATGKETVHDCGI